MKALSRNNTSVAEAVITAQSGMKVCMCVLGIARNDVRVMRAATALAGAGFVVSTVDVECESVRPAEEDIFGIHMKHVIMPSWFIPTRFNLWLLLKVVQVLFRYTLRLMQTPADIYHAHDLAALLPCYFVACLFRKPIIFEAHELPPAETSILLLQRLSGLLKRLLVMILPRCAGVITVSPPIAQEIRNRYSIPEVTLIRNVPPYRAVPKSDRLRQHLGISPDVRIALYQGNLQPNRGLDRLIQAAAFLERDIVIVLMGKAYRTMQSRLEALIANEGVADRVKIIPPVPYTELLDWTASADIGLNILPPEYSLSIRMCLPNKLFEYLMAGLPVLTSELDAVIEVIRTYDVGYVLSSLAPKDVGTAINAMLADRSVLTHMRRNALQAAQEEFCWEKESNRLIRLYEATLGANLYFTRHGC